MLSWTAKPALSKKQLYNEAVMEEQGRALSQSDVRDPGAGDLVYDRAVECVAPTLQHLPASAFQTGNNPDMKA